MKIVGYTYHDSQWTMVMKSDSSLLNQRKPFFLPEWSQELVAMDCVVVRIARLGRHIARRFAHRYYDGVALGLNFRANDLMREGRWAEAVAFDDALTVGKWIEPSAFPKEQLPKQLPIEEAIERISEVMTLRTGDLLFVDTTTTPYILTREEEMIRLVGDEENLYCKIK